MIREVNNYNQAVIGVFLGGSNLRVGRVRNNEVEALDARILDRYGSEEYILKEILEAIEKVKTDDVVGIGVGVPSLVDVERGVVYKVQNIPSWREVHLGDILTERFGVEVYINNDANCFAVGEKHFGKGRNYKNVVGLVVGTGLGAGAILDGSLYSGTNCAAGEVGAFPYKDFDFEYYCSAKFFEEKYDIKYDILHERAEKEDKVALAMFEHYGNDMGNVLKTLIFAYDPELIVLGGSISKSYSFFEKFMLKTLRNFPYKHVVNKVVVALSEDENISIKGAAALYFNAQKKR